MCELGQLGVVANHHSALYFVAKLAKHVKQLIRPDGVQPIIDQDILALVIELLGDDLRRLERARRWARQDQVGLYIAFRQSLAHPRRVALAAIVQWTILVGQCWVIPTRLGVADEK